MRLKKFIVHLIIAFVIFIAGGIYLTLTTSFNKDVIFIALTIIFVFYWISVQIMELEKRIKKYNEVIK